MDERKKNEPQSMAEYHKAEKDRLNQLVASGVLKETEASNGYMYSMEFPGGDFPVAIALRHQDIVVRSGDIALFERDKHSEKYRIGEFSLDEMNGELHYTAPSPNVENASMFRIQDISENLSAMNRQRMANG